MKFTFSKRHFFKAMAGASLSGLPLRVLANLGENASLTKAFSKALRRKQDLRVAFGSCHFHDGKQDHWAQISRERPDLWLWLGDNIYGDSRDISVIKAKYHKVEFGPYAQFRRTYPIDGIWDDHDFGEDNANKTYPLKEQTQQLHLDFLGVSQEDPRRFQEGIYHTREELDGQIKFFFLDTRYFKDEDKGKDATLLGEAQWQWLENEMASSTAAINIFVTPIGFLLNRLFVTEDWAEYPTDKDRLLECIAKYDLSGAFFMSGDKHFGAFIKRSWQRKEERVDYFEFQSSGMTHVAPKSQLAAVKKLYGKKNTVIERNFGKMDFYHQDGHFFMVWSLHSLESHRFLSRVFYLDDQGLWQRP